MATEQKHQHKDIVQEAESKKKKQKKDNIESSTKEIQMIISPKDNPSNEHNDGSTQESEKKVKKNKKNPSQNNEEETQTKRKRKKTKTDQEKTISTKATLKKVPEKNKKTNNKHNQKKDIKSKKRNAKPKKKKYWTTAKKIIMTLCILLILLLGSLCAYVMLKMSKIQTSTLDIDKLNINSDLQYDETGYLNVALFGLDTRAKNESMGTRSDTIMIASLNRETKEVKLVSVYRDTLLQQEDGTYNKANASYSFGGVEEAISMLNKNLDMDIQYYVTVDFSALVHVINAVGGIEIEVEEEEIYYINGYGAEITENTGVETTGVTETGLQNLDGVQATAYARIRYTQGDDYRRTERQRTVLTKTAEKLQQADLVTLNKIIDKVFPMVETNFTMTEILAYAKDITKYWFGETTGFPFEKTTMVYEDAGDSVIPCTLVSNVKDLHKLLFPEVTFTPSYRVQEISNEIVSITGIGSYDEPDDTTSDYSDSSYEENLYEDSYYEGDYYEGESYEDSSYEENYYEEDYYDYGYSEDGVY